MKTAAEAVYTPDSPNHPTQSLEQVKDSLNSACFLTVVEHLHEIMTALREVFPNQDWHIRWQKLTRR